MMEKTTTLSISKTLPIQETTLLSSYLCTLSPSKNYFQLCQTSDLSLMPKGTMNSILEPTRNVDPIALSLTDPSTIGEIPEALAQGKAKKNSSIVHCTGLHATKSFAIYTIA